MELCYRTKRLRWNYACRDIVQLLWNYTLEVKGYRVKEQQIMECMCMIQMHLKVFMKLRFGETNT